jgi:hypothetical protein
MFSGKPALQQVVEQIKENPAQLKKFQAAMGAGTKQRWESISSPQAKRYTATQVDDASAKQVFQKADEIDDAIARQIFQKIGSTGIDEFVAAATSGGTATKEDAIKMFDSMSWRPMDPLAAAIISA